ncbi:MAG: hypothetical protein RI985_1093, partial [Chloroflexota bacterium]
LQYVLRWVYAKLMDDAHLPEVHEQSRH